MFLARAEQKFITCLARRLHTAVKINSRQNRLERVGKNRVALSAAALILALSEHQVTAEL